MIQRHNILPRKYLATQQLYVHLSENKKYLAKNLHMYVCTYTWRMRNKTF